MVRVGKKHFFIYSLHTDGSVQVSTLSKPFKENIEEELQYIKENEKLDNQGENGDKKMNENVDSLRKNISEVVRLDALKG